MAKKGSRQGLPVYQRDYLVDLEVHDLKLFPSQDVKNEELDATHAVYDENIDEWIFRRATYSGIKALLKLDLLWRHERESEENWDRRRREMYSFGYTKSIVDLFTFYLFKHEVERQLGTLSEDPLWQLFMDDCDLYGTELDEYLNEQSKYASIYGHVGVLVDKPVDSSTVDEEGNERTVTRTRADDVKNGLYPYLAAYHPPSILDWQYARDKANRPYLAYLKLLDDEGRYRCWWPDKWEVWQKDEENEDGDDKAILVAEGVNTLGVIPFVWLYNEKTEIIGMGESDVEDIAHIELAIIRNLSQGEEVINYSAFPMLLLPKERVGQESSDEVGVKAILEFDPENPNAKPEWMTPEVSGPITSILQWISRKVAEIYRASNAGGMSSTELSTDAKSGAALEAEFQLLNSKLCKKAVQLEKAELGVIYFWLLWQRMQAKYADVMIRRERKYDVENLARDLADDLTAMTIVTSQLFKAEIQKTVARRMLPAVADETMDAIDAEIEAGPVEDDLGVEEADA